MHIEIDGSGKVNLSVPQQKWGGGTPGVMQQARFAGQEVMAITDDAGAFDLHYLGFKTGGFKTIEEAKIAAPEFTRKVLAHMTSLIVN
jgi:hypothetical protein